ncbi:MAG: alpha/beta hydrolase [Actinomycetota bacterium]
MESEEVLIPEWSGFVPVIGGSLYVEIDGSGPAIVLVHAGVANLRMWDHHIAALAQHYTVIRYDTRGFGRTASEHVEFSNRADLVAALDHAGAKLAILVGVSRGGSIVLDTALEYSARTAGLVFVAGGISGFEPKASLVDPAVWEEAEAHWTAKDWDWLADFETALWADGPGQPTDRVDPKVRQSVHEWILSNYRAEKEEGIPQTLVPPAVGRLGELAMPVLVAIGLRDEAGVVEACRHLAASVPGAEVVEFDTAHMVNMEEPERFTRMLLDFAAATYS